MASIKKILAYVTPDKNAGFFDLVVAYDSEVDAIATYTEISPFEMKEVIYGAVFTRAPKDLKNTAIFIGGSDFWKCYELLKTSIKIFENLPKDLRVSVAFDPDGACTTAAACVIKIKSSIEISGKNSVILAGTGPVGQSTAIFLAKENSNVAITSRKFERAKEITEKLNREYKISISPLQASNEKETERVISNADIVISTGPEGVRTLRKELWMKFPELKILADVNAVPPLGIEGVQANDNSTERDGKICFGAFSIGNLKMKIHSKLMKIIFEEKDIYDAEKIYEIAKSFT
ncbi:MAG: methylene-tetrahydromethanopterin dehydrogenase N-terminal domain-containing protein [Candidatus Altiarchaeota archaeon]